LKIQKIGNFFGGDFENLKMTFKKTKNKNKNKNKPDNSDILKIPNWQFFGGF